jgi:phosphate transport system substrate-binding protein
VEPSHDIALLAPGRIIGGAYRVVRALAEGGMGTVYEVEQITTGARRALKVMHGHFAADGSLRARFVAEARIVAGIPSDHVAQVVDAGHDEDTGTLFIVMELLEGTTLSRELRRREAFAWRDVVEIVRQIAHALGAAHARGVVHRDLKPANVFLSRSRHAGIRLMVKVLDFGIAKAVAGVNDAPLAVLGTPAWMAPEQTALDGAIGPQTDVWALGLLTFLMLTGKHFFPGANVKNANTATLLREVVVEPIIPASVRATQLGQADRLPPDFDQWFARCVVRDPAARFADASVAYEALSVLAPPLSTEHAPATLSVDPLPIAPTPMTAVVRADAHVTAIETPLAARVSRAGMPSGAPAKTRPEGEGGTPKMAAAGLIVAIVALVAAAAIAMVLVVTNRRNETLGATSLVMPPPPAPTPARTIARLHGSNTIGAELAPALAEAFLRRRTGAATVVRRRTAADELVVEARQGERPVEQIEVFAHGSATAFEDLAAGKCDIGMSSRRIHDDEVTKLGALGNLASAASEHVIALDGIAVIVNPTNPVSSLTKAQIAQIFSGAIRSWSEVGGADRPIAVFARDDKSGTYDTFRTLVLGSTALVSGAARIESSEALSDAVAGDERAIGFIGLPYVRSAKAVMVKDAGSVPLLPSPMTVSTESYPLARRLYLYVPLGAAETSRDFLDFALSEDGQRVVQSAGFVDLRPECDPNAAACTGCSAAYRDAVRDACRLSIDFRFDRGSTQLDTRALRDLQRIVALMGRPANSERSLLLFGFSDGKGPRPDNLALSDQRAGIVASQLRARGLHVAVARGLGPDMPVADDATEEGRERNRRVEVWLR